MLHFDFQRELIETIERARAQKSEKRVNGEGLILISTAQDVLRYV